jgi:hypothetical protein
VSPFGLIALSRTPAKGLVFPSEPARRKAETLDVYRRLARRPAPQATTRPPGQADRPDRPAEGRALVDRAVEAHLQNEERLLAGLSPAKRTQLAGLLRELLVRLDTGARAET